MASCCAGARPSAPARKESWLAFLTRPFVGKAEEEVPAATDSLEEPSLDSDQQAMTGETLLLTATVAGNAAAAALLLEQNADVNLANDAGFTPLMAAARLGSGSCVRLLCEHKADVRAELPDGRTALDLALATHEEGEQGAEEEANPMALPPESALVLSLLQQMEDEQFEADEQAAVAEVEAQAATEVEHAVRRSSEALSPTQRK